MKSENKYIKVGTFFSGIGAPEKALERLKDENYIKDYEVMFFSEIDKNDIKSYCAIHNIDESLNVGDIKKVKGKDLPYCDLWIGGFPCQDISCAGKMRGFDSTNSTRSSLGWEMIRLIKEVKDKPKYVIFENVSMIKSKKFETTLDLFKSDLRNLGYTLYEKILNAIDFGIPQTRRRYFLVAILDQNIEFDFPEEKETDLILKDFLDNEVDEKYILSEANHIYYNKGNLVFKNIKRPEIKYVIDKKKFKLGGVYGEDLHSNFRQSKVIFSSKGYLPTLTASNTTDNCKIVIGEE